MILPDEEVCEPHPKTQQPRVPEGAGGSSAQRSDTPVDDGDVPPPYSPGTHTTPLLGDSMRIYRKRAKKRFFDTLCTSIATIVLSAAILWLWIDIRIDGGHRKKKEKVVEGIGSCTNADDGAGILYPYPGDDKYYANLAVHILSEVPSVLITSPRDMAFGQINVISTPEFRGPRPEFRVRAGHRSIQVLKHVYLCGNVINGSQFVASVFIAPFLDEKDIPKEKVQFDISFYLPNYSYRSSKPTRFKELKMDMPYFTHVFEPMAQYAYFHNLSIRATESPVLLKGVKAGNVRIQNNGGPINANLSIVESAHIQGHRSVIEAELNVTNMNPEPGQVYISSTEGALMSAFRLFTPSGTDGTFNITTRTGQSSANVTFLESPPQSELLLDTVADRGSLGITLPPAFEGDFRLQSQSVEINMRKDLKDPLGHNRQRDVRYRLTGPGDHSDNVDGSVRWLPQTKKVQGNVSVVANHCPALLVV